MSDNPTHRDLRDSCTVDKRSFELGKRVGGVIAFCGAASTGVKRMSLSSLFAPGEYEALLPYVREAAHERNVGFWLERDLPRTDLFPDIDASGLWVFVIYRDSDALEEYLDLRKQIAELEGAGRYSGPIRREIAFRFGRLLGYSEDFLNGRLSHSGD